MAYYDPDDSISDQELTQYLKNWADDSQFPAHFDDSFVIAMWKHVHNSEKKLTDKQRQVLFNIGTGFEVEGLI